MFLCDPFDVGVESTSIVNCTCFVHSLLYILNSNGESKFLSGETVFSDELLVNAGDVSARVYQHGGVNDFEGVQRGDQLNRDTHRFI